MGIITFPSLGTYGELGNQLFQIASTIGQGRNLGLDPIFTSWYCPHTNQNLYDIFEKRLPVNPNIDINGFVSYTESAFNYVEVPFFENISLYGYFQSEKYFKNSENEIKELFKIPSKIKTEIEYKYNDILNQSNTVGFHMRFATRPMKDHLWAHGSLTDEFFLNCISYLGGDKFYIICTDDNERAKDFFNKYKPNLKYIIPNDRQLIELYLLTLTDYVVTSNSSFGWWGAYLNEKAKEKLAPHYTKWFTEIYIQQENKNTKDIIPEIWKQINF